MTNLEALKATCNAICNTFYPDNSTLKLMLFNEGVNPELNATPKDVTIVKIAIKMAMGFVESGKSIGGVSTSNLENAVNNSISKWCTEYGLNASEFINITKITNGSNRW